MSDYSTCYKLTPPGQTESPKTVWVFSTESQARNAAAQRFPAGALIEEVQVLSRIAAGLPKRAHSYEALAGRFVLSFLETTLAEDQALFESATEMLLNDWDEPKK